MKLHYTFQLFVYLVVWLVPITLRANATNSFSWLDPEKKIYVLQNRKYTKADRFLISALVGRGMNNAYRTTTHFEARGAYYFSEQLGLETLISGIVNAENTNFRALVSASANTRPVIRETKSNIAFLVHWVPWYAKINFFNEILYFDWYLSGGPGYLISDVEVRDLTATNVFQFTGDNRIGFFLGTGHQYHLSDKFTVRLDLTGVFFRAPLLGTTGETTWFSQYTFGAGLGLRL